MVTINKIGDMHISAISEIQKSKNLLKKCLYIFLTINDKRNTKYEKRRTKYENEG